MAESDIDGVCLIYNIPEKSEEGGAIEIIGIITLYSISDMWI